MTHSFNGDGIMAMAIREAEIQRLDISLPLEIIKFD